MACVGSIKQRGGNQMTEWEEFLNELKSQADAMVKTSPVKIEIKPIGENASNS